MLTIDGSMGEGGGQVLRSALTLSLLTGKAIRIYSIRQGRKRSGLMPQHLAAVQAAAAVGHSEVEGARKGSKELIFRPKGIYSGNYNFDIGTAGSTTLVLQTVFLPLSFAANPSKISITGGTHVPWSPCYHYLDLHWQPMLEMVGYAIRLDLQHAGFYPHGGGILNASIEPAGKLVPLDLRRRGRLLGISGLAAVADLPLHIAERMKRRTLWHMSDREGLLNVVVEKLPTRSPGAFLLLCANFKRSRACYVGLGKRGKPAEQLADECIDELQNCLSGDASIDPWLADQLLLPLVLVPGRSYIRTERITSHLLTLRQLIQQFLKVSITIDGKEGQAGVVTIDGVELVKP